MWLHELSTHYVGRVGIGMGGGIVLNRVGKQLDRCREK